ncbi:hypothetical protein J6590_002267 [Homalodisca vitripennis]|nr:hypothetical protein J6590_002267 [Homalodisca vitripennis]
MLHRLRLSDRYSLYGTSVCKKSRKDSDISALYTEVPVDDLQPAVSVTNVQSLSLCCVLSIPAAIISDNIDSGEHIAFNYALDETIRTPLRLYYTGKLLVDWADYFFSLGVPDVKKKGRGLQITDVCGSVRSQTSVEVSDHRRLWKCQITDVCRSVRSQTPVEVSDHRPLWKCQITDVCGSVRSQTSVEVSDHRRLWKCQITDLCGSVRSQTSVEVSDHRRLWKCQITDVCGSVRSQTSVEVSDQITDVCRSVRSQTSVEVSDHRRPWKCQITEGEMELNTTHLLHFGVILESKCQNELERNNFQWSSDLSTIIAKPWSE